MLRGAIRVVWKRLAGVLGVLLVFVLPGVTGALPVFVLPGCAPATVRSAPLAENGRIDLRAWDFGRDGPVRLDGDWRWYWRTLAGPGDIEIPATGVFRVPGIWNGHQVGTERIDGRGYATFRLHLELPRAGQYGLLLRYTACAYRMWVDQTLVASSGVIGTTAERTVPASITRLVAFNAAKPSADITLQLATFDHTRGGPWASAFLGDFDQVRDLRERQIVLYAFLLGALALMVIYQIVLYLLRPVDRAPVYLAAFCALIGIGQLMQGPLLFTLVVPDVHWDRLIRLEFTALALAPCAAALFIRALYPGEYPQALRLPAQLVFVAFAALTAVTPTRFSTGLFPIYAVALTLSVLAHSWVVLRAARRRRAEVIISMLGLMPLFVTVIVDAIAVVTRPLYFQALVPVGLTCLIAAESFVVARRAAQAHLLVEQQAERLSRLNTAYYRFVPQAFLRLLGKEDIVTVRLGDQTQREMAVLFADVRGFTSMSERMSLEENFAFLNRLLGLVSPIIREHGGFIDKYLGDGVMALFPGSAEDALQAAIDMQQVLATFNARSADGGGESIEVGIGVHSGTLMLGTVGEPERMDGTVIADAVNTAARLEGLTRRYGVTTLVSARVVAQLPEPARYALRALGRVRPKGKLEPVAIYEVFAEDPEPVARLKRETRAAFEAGLAAYEQGRFEEAARLFEQVAAANPADSVAAYYVRQSRAWTSRERPAGWDGVEVLTEK